VTVEADAPAGAVIRIVCDGRTVIETPAGATYGRALEAGEMGRSCQAVVGWPGASRDRFVTWAVTNPVYWRREDVLAQPAEPVAGRSEVLAAAASAWVVEHNGSEATLTPAGAPAPPQGSSPVTLAYGLAPGARAGQYAAMVTSDIGTLGWAHWLRLRLQADRPMRVSLQVRRPGAGQASQRWQRSLVVGPEPSSHVVPLASLAPLEDASGPPPATEVRSLLVVVDTVNTSPGRRGWVTVHEIRAEAP
jgi:hypothetical protein